MKVEVAIIDRSRITQWVVLDRLTFKTRMSDS